MIVHLHEKITNIVKIRDNIVDYLNDPWLVVKVQSIFGIKYEKKYKAVHFPGGTNKFAKYDELSFHLRKDIRVKEKTVAKEEIGYQINNMFWYYFFFIGTALGDEIFYSTFFPFWFWNIDVTVGRKFILVWTTCMYIGQVLKEIIRSPRPGYPVHKLQEKWALEYGMPSTHAMVGVAMPFSILIFTMGRYHYSTYLGVLIAFSCCCLICVSRIYLGMHSILDVIVGVLLASLIMVILIPCVNWIDGILLTSQYSPLLLIVSSLVLILYHPSADKWTPTRGDSTIVVSVCAGGFLGCWFNYQLGYTTTNVYDLPYAIPRLTLTVICMTSLRTIIGFIGLFVTRKVCKSITESCVALLLNKNKSEIKSSENGLANKSKITMDLSSKYITYGMISFNTLFTLPLLFDFLQINGFYFYCH